jgi:beta-glucanase (GH16 family)
MISLKIFFGSSLLIPLISLPLLGQEAPSMSNGRYEEYTLVWADEFSTDGVVSSSNWFHQTKLPAGNSWYNGEVQHYTDELANSSVANGMLSITAIKEQYTDQGVTKSYTSARLNSKFAFTYGRVDARAKLPSGNGTWPAIWTLGRNISESGGFWSNAHGTTPWPACGEIDIMEHWGNNPNVIHGSLHTPSSSGATVNTRKVTIPNVSTEFHLYSMIWDSDKIQFLVDNEPFYTYLPNNKNSATWPFDKPQYLLLNIAMGGIGGAIDPNFTSSSMEIDYIRVYQKQTGQTEEDPITAPTAAATQPTEKPNTVISLFSDAYSSVSVDTWLGTGSVGTLEEIVIDESAIKKYNDFSYALIETKTNPINISGMTHLRLSIWSPNSTQFKLELVDYGNDGILSGDDSEHEFSFRSHSQGAWENYFISLSSFSGLTSIRNLAEIKFSSVPEGSSVVYLDNVFFFNPAGPLGNNQIDLAPTIRISDQNLQVIFDPSIMVQSFQVFDTAGRMILADTDQNPLANIIDADIHQSGLKIIRIFTDQGIIVQRLIF